MTQWSLLSQQEIRDWGEEALSIMARKAQEVVGPIAQDLQRENQRLRDDLQKVKAHDIYSVLDQNLPNWREINVSREFVQWLQGYDPYSNQPKSVLLRNAFDSGDAGRVLTIFRGYLSETQQSAPTARTSRMPVDNSPATISDKDIERFYENVRKGYYTGREKEKDREEMRLHHAILQGRLRRTTP
jgi:hypothetical protein